jgi:hypothetical protein
VITIKGHVKRDLRVGASDSQGDGEGRARARRTDGFERRRGLHDRPGRRLAERRSAYRESSRGEMQCRKARIQVGFKGLRVAGSGSRLARSMTVAASGR